MLTEKDREFLLEACAKAEAARRPPEALGRRLEPTWAALLANKASALASAAFVSGDKKDAVAKLLESFRPLEHSQEELTLYVTLEPRAGFERLPPVTESVKRLGVKRVVIGAEDPSPRFRGEGCRTLERMGVELILADGEEARRCQLLLEDYAKAVQKGLPVVRVPGALAVGDDGTFDFRPEAVAVKRSDAVIGGSASEETWLVDIDLADKAPVKRSRVISYRPRESGNVRRLPMKEGQVDLGALLRDLCSLGILSVELQDPSLFGQALSSELVDTVVARLPDEDTNLSRYEQVRFQGPDRALRLRLSGAKLADSDSRYLEARGELC